VAPYRGEITNRTVSLLFLGTYLRSHDPAEAAIQGVNSLINVFEG
jgi:hypothetical protein